MSYLSALRCVHDEALYKSTFTFTFTFLKKFLLCLDVALKTYSYSCLMLDYVRLINFMLLLLLLLFFLIIFDRAY